MFSFMLLPFLPRFLRLLLNSGHVDAQIRGFQHAGMGEHLRLVSLAGEIQTNRGKHLPPNTFPVVPWPSVTRGEYVRRWRDVEAGKLTSMCHLSPDQAAKQVNNRAECRMRTSRDCRTSFSMVSNNEMRHASVSPLVTYRASTVGVAVAPEATMSRISRLAALLLAECMSALGSRRPAGMDE